MLRFAPVGALALLLGAVPSSPTPTVSVVAFYRERMMLPSGASLHVRLTDASTGRDLASATLDNPHVPVHLDLAYEPSNITATHVYTVTARILVDGDPFFATETPANVITQGNPSQVDVLLVRVTPESPALIEDRQWTLWELNGQAINTAHRPTLELRAGRASGSGGCNRFNGGYKLNGGTVEFAAPAATMMMCMLESVMNNEGAFFKALPKARYWNVTSANLQLLDGQHKVLMQLESDN